MRYFSQDSDFKGVFLEAAPLFQPIEGQTLQLLPVYRLSSRASEAGLVQTLGVGGLWVNSDHFLWLGRLDVSDVVLQEKHFQPG